MTTAREACVIVGTLAALLGIGLFDVRVALVVGGLATAGAGLYGMVRR